VVSWQALFAPAGTPKPIVDKLHAEILKIIQTPEMQERIKGLGMQPSTLTPEQVQAFQKAEIDKWAGHQGGEHQAGLITSAAERNAAATPTCPRSRWAFLHQLGRFIWHEVGWALM